MGPVVAVHLGQRREGANIDRLVDSLLLGARSPSADSVSSPSFVDLPAPVARYFSHVLPKDQHMIRTARLRQAGELRTSTTTDNWYAFTATQVVVPGVPGFVWNAKVAMPLATHVGVLDSYNAGIGAGRVTVLSAFAVASEAGAPELNSGALHRYLAEAVWYPTALLPQSGVQWTSVNDRAALATLTDRGTTVSLEFRFNETGEAVGIYSPGRFRRSEGGYEQVPWEGHFRNYVVRSGIRVPAYGEVGWNERGQWRAVWKGNLIDVQYELVP